MFRNAQILKNRRDCQTSFKSKSAIFTGAGNRLKQIKLGTMIFYSKISKLLKDAVKITLNLYILDRFLFFCKAFFSEYA
jgi:hypothetical protein